MNEENDWELMEYENEDGDVFVVLAKDGAWQSAAFVDVGMMYENVFQYCDAFDLMFDDCDGIKDVLMLGGGTFTYPMHIIAQCGVEHCDAVEIDEALLDVAYDFFHLGQFEKTHPGKLDKHFMDWRAYLAECDKKYDAIVGDVYDGRQISDGFDNARVLEKIASCIKPGGVYVFNFVGNSDSEKEMGMEPCLDILERLFVDVTIVKVSDDMEDEKYCSYVVFAYKDKE